MNWFSILLAALLIPATVSAIPVGEVLPLGDSITHGMGGTGGGYRARLYFLLNNAGDSFNFVGSATDNSTATLNAAGQYRHEGHPGYRIEHIATSLLSTVGDGSDNGGYWLNGGHGTGRGAIFPDLILLHIGTNDVLQGRTAAQMQSALQNLLEVIQDNRPNAQVIVASIIMVDDPDIEPVVQEYNSAIPGMVAGMGPNFHFLDMHSVLNASDLVDGVHPTQGGYDKMANAWMTVLPSVAAAEPLSLVAAVSQKTHGAAGTLGINLPLTGAPGVECRSGGNHKLVLTFTNRVVSGSANVTTGIGAVSGNPTFAANVMTVNLVEVADAQQIIVTLSNMNDAYGQILGNTPVKMNVLLGDTTGNKTVNSSDISQTKSQSGQPVVNPRTDVTASGSVNASDISFVKSRSGKSIP